ncbi:hypothetical protein [Nonomuraea deserti]|uniref:hypothetical protein n=1 Tax=Nonomuraea deserti TaxID=1848322 RepID=UPI001FEA349D|nr:hypothetical protein [Nonomuraea deserti]
MRASIASSRPAGVRWVVESDGAVPNNAAWWTSSRSASSMLRAPHTIAVARSRWAGDARG